MSKQDEFNAQLAELGTAVDNLTTAIRAEIAELQIFINGYPQLDTSGLSAIVGRLNAATAEIGGIFTPPADEPAETDDDTIAEEPPAEGGVADEGEPV